jgi:WD40 repeat protein
MMRRHVWSLAAAAAVAAPAAMSGAADPAVKPSVELKASNGVHRMALSPDGKLLALGIEDGPLAVVDAATLKPRVTLMTEKKARPECLAFSPDSDLLAAGTFAGFWLTWQMPAARALQNVNAEGPVDALSFSPDGRSLATFSIIGGVGRWDPRTGNRLAKIPLSGPGSDRVGNETVFCADGKTLAISSVIDTDHTVRVWDASTGKLRRHFKQYPRLVDRLALSDDGRLLLTGSQDGMVRLWDVATGQSLLAWKVGGFVTAVAISPDGKQVAASTDGTPDALVWDRAAARVVHRLPGHPDGARDLVFTPDGKQLYSAAFNVVRRWELTRP